jgi:pimeloyl-ACP methyl ester carboxylesterase
MLVDVGGHQLFVEQFGPGSPAVIFDAGLSDAADRWGTVPTLVAKFARVCVYDRAGLGRSESGPQPRTSGGIVAELHAALVGAGIAPPYILVGHSFGGQNVRLYASRFPEDVAGLVLVDAVHPAMARRFAPILTPAQWEEFLAGQRGNREGVDLVASAAEMAMADPLPPIPLVTLARGIAPLAKDFPPDWPIAALEAVWQELQGELAASSPNGVLWRAERSGHYIQRDEPELVVAAIRHVLHPNVIGV